ncbi:MAG: hypothetical protein ATN35_12980 [Epulopiscium sp. Nele67-Bin004]|nr:MAG: hypothetical protein ATN35_12980 [Epulopiscium sp. Nele67-Bin004]
MVRHLVSITKFVLETIALTFFGMFVSYINLVDILFSGIGAIFVVIAFGSYIPALLLIQNPEVYKKQLNLKDKISSFSHKDFIIKKMSKSAIKKVFKPILSRISGPIFARIVARLSFIGLGIGL